MSNNSYLCCGLRRDIYPSSREGDYSSDEQTVATAAYRVPLIWLCLFRPEDMVEQELSVSDSAGEAVTARVRAPVVERRLVKDRLKEAVPRLEAAFPKCGSLRTYATKFREALDSVHKAYPFVTIEYEEVAAIAGAERWDGIILRVLEYLAGKDVPEARERLLDAADLDEIRRFVPLNRFLGDDVEDDDWIILDALLGGEFERAVPWLPQAAFRESLPPSELMLAIRAGQADRVAELVQAGADVNTTDSDGTATPLEMALLSTAGKPALSDVQLRIVELLVAAQARITDEALAQAARVAPLELFQSLFAANPNANACDRLGRPVLHYACESTQGATEKARLLLDAGADVNRRTPTHYSALGGVFQSGNLELARLLFERGLDSYAADEVMGAVTQANRRSNAFNNWVELIQKHRTQLYG